MIPSPCPGVVCQPSRDFSCTLRVIMGQLNQINHDHFGAKYCLNVLSSSFITYKYPRVARVFICSQRHVEVQSGEV